MELKDLALQYLYAKTISKPSGIVIFHAFRPNEAYFIERGEERRDEDENLGEELKKWEWIRSKSNWYDYIEYSPHFHFVGYVGWLNPPERGENFIYKTITENGKVKVLNGDKKGLFRLIYYLLSHTCDKIDKSRYFHPYILIGNISCRYGTTIELERYHRQEEKHIHIKKQRCKECGGPLWFLDQNLRSFLKIWCNISLDDYNPSTACLLREVVLENRRIPHKIKMNVLECIDLYFEYFDGPFSEYISILL